MSARSIRRNSERAAARRLSRRAKLATGATIVASSAVLAPGASAASFTVNSLADPGAGGCDAAECTLREAVDEADANAETDTITFAPGLTGEITLASELTISSGQGITIDGPGVDVVSISGDTNTDDTPNMGDTYVLEVTPGGRVSISDLTITEGFRSGSKYAGGISAEQGSIVSITDAAVTDSYGTLGGGISNYGGTLTVTRTEVSGNEANFGGGGIITNGQKYDDALPSPIVAETTITNSEITGNEAGVGAGIANFGGKYLTATTPTSPNPDNGLLTVSGSEISGNTSTAGAGVFAKYGTTDVANTEISGNTGQGGVGLLIASGDATLVGSTISGNDSTTSGTGSGAISAGKYARFDIRNSDISNNDAGGYGGGLTISLGLTSGAPGFGYTSPPPDPAVTVTNSTIAGNTAMASGGGIAIYDLGSDSSVLVDSTTISGNAADAAGSGGGVALTRNLYPGAELDFVDSTISGNSAGYGGGVALGYPYATPPSNQIDASGSPDLGNTTIADNTAAVSGGGIYLGGYSTDPTTPGSPSASADVPLSSTIVADNRAAGSPNDLAAATVDQPGSFRAGSSLIETPGTATVTQNPAGSNILGTDPQLGALANNGGPTLSHLPAATSPVIDEGVANGLTTDQRGLARTVAGGTDIGSVEVQAQPVPPDTTAPKVTFGKKPKKKITTKKARAKVKLTFTSDEAGSTFECKVDKKAFKPCTSPLKVKVKSKPKKGKKHTISVRATDNVGNTGPAATVKFKVIRKG